MRAPQKFWMQLSINAIAGLSVTGLALVVNDRPAVIVGGVFLVLALALLVALLAVKGTRL